MSDFSVMDAIECGIVKPPRVPIADNVPGGDTPRFRNLWDHNGKKLSRKGRAAGRALDAVSLPVEQPTVLETPYGHDKNWTGPGSALVRCSCRAAFCSKAQGDFRSRGIVCTLVETAKRDGVDPHACLAIIIARILDHKITKVDDLLPSR